MMYLLTTEEHAQVVDALNIGIAKHYDLAEDLRVGDALAILKAMKPAKPKGWVTQAGTVTGAIAGDGSAHDGERLNLPGAERSALNEMLCGNTTNQRKRTI